MGRKPKLRVDHDQEQSAGLPLIPNKIRIGPDCYLSKDKFIQSLKACNNSNNFIPLKVYTPDMKHKLAEIFDNKDIPPTYDEVNP